MCTDDAGGRQKQKSYRKADKTSMRYPYGLTAAWSQCDRPREPSGRKARRLEQTPHRERTRGTAAVRTPANDPEWDGVGMRQYQRRLRRASIARSVYHRLVR